MKNRLLFISIALVFIVSLILSVQENQKKEEGNLFLQSKIRFDNSSLEKIVLHPESILDDPEAFWKNDPAYKLYGLWHQFASYPVDMDQWKKNLQPFIDTPENERHHNSQLLLSKKMLKEENEKSFNKRAVPFLYSFLPENCPPIDATIYFTTAILTNGFQMDDDVVIYGENADKENLFIHELFHRCQRACKTIIPEHEYDNNELDQIYLLLWIEGTATYVGYKALNEFPSVDPLLQKDYKLIEDTMSFNRLLQKLNEIFVSASKIDTNSNEQNELQKRLMKTGVMDRAFYVVGYHMASIIDEKLGRNALRETLLYGPQYYIQKYNSLVDAEYKIFDLYSMK